MAWVIFVGVGAYVRVIMGNLRLILYIGLTFLFKGQKGAIQLCEVHSSERRRIAARFQVTVKRQCCHLVFFKLFDKEFLCLPV